MLCIASFEVSWHQFIEVGINFLSTTKDYWARSQFGLILLSTVSNMASVDPQRCLRWSPQCLSWGQLVSIFWARPKITEHGLRLTSFYWARSQIWPQVGISIASGGLHITSTALSDIDFLNTTKFGWARSHFGLKLASVLPQVVSALPQLLWVASIFWAQTYLAEHSLKLASGWHQHCLKWSLHYINCLEWHHFFEHGQIWLSTVSLWPHVGISWASALPQVTKNP